MFIENTNNGGSCELRSLELVVDMVYYVTFGLGVSVCISELLYVIKIRIGMEAIYIEIKKIRM
jgi:hypothetical protein